MRALAVVGPESIHAELLHVTRDAHAQVEQVHLLLVPHSVASVTAKTRPCDVTLYINKLNTTYESTVMSG